MRIFYGSSGEEEASNKRISFSHCQVDVVTFKTKNTKTIRLKQPTRSKLNYDPSILPTLRVMTLVTIQPMLYIFVLKIWLKKHGVSSTSQLQ